MREQIVAAAAAVECVCVDKLILRVPPSVLHMTRIGQVRLVKLMSVRDNAEVTMCMR